MLKMIMDQHEIILANKELSNWAENVNFGLDVEFSQDDKRYNVGEAMICVSVYHDYEEDSKPELDIELGIDGSVYDLTNEEVNTIKSQLIEAGLLNYERVIN